MLEFEPNRHDALWGYEEWVISAHRSSPSVIAAGAHKGETLDRLFPKFPLLFKVIDAKSRLSVQVHPNDATCRICGGEAKSEMWCILEAGPIYAGFRPGVSAEDVAAAVGNGSFEDLLVRHDAKPGEAFYIPGGLVHAIGDGVKLFEVQQSSDTTFRLYDWGRVGADGKPRQLHVAQALQAMDLNLPPPTPAHEVVSPYFRFSKVAPGNSAELESGDGFLSVFDGRKCRLYLPGERVAVQAEDAPVHITRFPFEGSVG